MTDDELIARHIATKGVTKCPPALTGARLDWYDNRLDGLERAEHARARMVDYWRRRKSGMVLSQGARLPA